MSAPLPTRWITQMRTQLGDADRRIASADRRLREGDGGRALQDAYPGVMAAALVRVWLADEPWRRTRTYQEYSQLVRAELPSGFAALAEVRAELRGFGSWRAEDARPLVREAREFVSSVHAELERRIAPPRPSGGTAGAGPAAG